MKDSIMRAVRGVLQRATSGRVNGRSPAEQSAACALPEGLAARLAGVRVAFGTRQVLHDVHLDVPSGMTTVLIGRSGSGKSTLLRVLQRLNECLPGCTTTGRVLLRLDGRVVDAYSGAVGDPSWLRARMGMVFQSPDVLPLSIRRNMDMTLRHVLCLPETEVAPRMEEALREAALWDEVHDRLDENALGLSGGQQQRLCLPRALALRPAFLLLDEPTASLDIASARAIEERITSLGHTRTVVMVSHGLRQALRLADNLVLVDAGRVVRVWNRHGAGLPDVAELEHHLED